MPKMSVMVSEEINETIKKLAKADRRSVSDYVARLVQAHVARKSGTSE